MAKETLQAVIEGFEMRRLYPPLSRWANSLKRDLRVKGGGESGKQRSVM